MKRFGIMKLRIVLCIIGTAFLALGIYRGEAGSVLMKSIRICLECVGIG